jgi:hypothetical protein
MGMNGKHLSVIALRAELHNNWHFKFDVFEGHHWTKYTIRLSRLELDLNNIFIWQEPSASGRIPQRFTRI